MAKKSAKQKTSKAIATQSGTKSKILIEIVDEPDVVSLQFEGGSIAGGVAVAAKTLDKMKEIGNSIAEVCRSIQKEVQTALAEAAPDELSLEFGIKLAGEAGIPLITKGSAEGTIKVTAKWSKN
jgi:hypothetical protein